MNRSDRKHLTIAAFIGGVTTALTMAILSWVIKADLYIVLTSGTILGGLVGYLVFRFDEVREAVPTAFAEVAEFGRDVAKELPNLGKYLAHPPRLTTIAWWSMVPAAVTVNRLFVAANMPEFDDSFTLFVSVVTLVGAPIIWESLLKSAATRVTRRDVAFRVRWESALLVGDHAWMLNETMRCSNITLAECLNKGEISFGGWRQYLRFLVDLSATDVLLLFESIYLVFWFLAIGLIPLLIKGTFLLFRLIHSEERVLTASYSILGGTAAFLIGTQYTGHSIVAMVNTAIIGGALSATMANLAYRLITVRLRQHVRVRK